MDIGASLAVDEVAQRLRASVLWLADACRAGKVEHVHLARQRRFTAEQIDKLIASDTVVPAAQVDGETFDLFAKRAPAAFRCGADKPADL